MSGSKHPDDFRNSSAPPHIKQSPILRYLWRRMHVNNKNCMICLVGDPGQGKSWAAIRLAELLDPTFNAEKVTFRPKRMLERINEEHPTGDITVADEAGVSMNAKTWWDSDQIQIGNILETWRHQNRGLIFTLPVFNKLQKDARGLIDVMMTAYGINRGEGTSRWRFQLLDTNNVTGEVYRPYPRLPDPESGVKTKMKTIDLARPSEELREDYQERKEAYTDELNESAIEQMEEEETEEEDTDPKDIANRILDDDMLDDYLSTHGGNGTQYVDKQLIRADFELSQSESKTVKALLEREI